jgi:uncharacterized protein
MPARLAAPVSGAVEQPGGAAPQHGRAPLTAWLELVWYLAVGFGLFLVSSLAIALAFDEISLLASLAIYAANFVCFAGTAYWLGVRRPGRSWADFGLRPFDRKWLDAALLAALLLLPVRSLAALAVEALVGGGLTDLQPRLDLMLPPGPLGLNLVVTLLGAGLLVPVAEELYFRGLLHGWLAGRLSLWPRVLFSSALFALGHFDNAGVVASSFILGLICALALERSRSLWLPVIVHAANNSLALIILYAAAGLSARLGT